MNIKRSFYEKKTNHQQLVMLMRVSFFVSDQVEPYFHTVIFRGYFNREAKFAIFLNKEKNIQFINGRLQKNQNVLD